MRRAHFLTEAREEFIAETKYYAEIQPELGLQFVAAVERALAIAFSFPLSGSPAPAGLKKVVIKKFPFTLIYHVIEEGIIVIAIAHHARKPNYWKNRSSSA